MNKAKKLTAIVSGIMLIYSVISGGNAYLSYAASLDNTKIGYGQGKSVDQDNCPYGALDFNSIYGQYDAFALSKDVDSIILTFDQGYENGYTESILNTLRDKNVKAIFFLTGDYAKKEKALVNRMIDEGHMLGNHGATHASMPDLSYEEVLEEIKSLHDYVLSEYNYEMQYLRPPCGEFSQMSLAAAQELGYKTIMWSFAYVDWNTDSQPSTSEAFNKMIDAAHGGGIYLLHSVSKTNSEVLGAVIDSLRAKGFTL